MTEILQGRILTSPAEPLATAIKTGYLSINRYDIHFQAGLMKNVVGSINLAHGRMIRFDEKCTEVFVWWNVILKTLL